MTDSLFQKQEQTIDTQQIKVFIIDDQKVVRAKLQDILSAHQDIKIVGMVDDAEKAITKIKFLQPDVVLMDIEMPKMDGIKLTEILSQRFPTSKILILSTHEEEEYAQQSICAGASGYVFKQTSVQNLVKAIYTVHQGYSHFGLKTLKKVQFNLADAEQAPPQEVDSSTDIQINRKTSPLIQKRNKAKKLETIPKTVSGSMPDMPIVKVEEFLPSIGKWISWGAIAVVTAIALGIPATSILKYKTKVKTTATVRPVGETRLVQSATEGKIIDIAVKRGQQVRLGDIVAQVDPYRWQTRKNQLEKAIAQQKLILNQLDSQIVIVTSQVQVERENNNAQILAAQAELTGNQRNYSQQKVQTNTQLKEAQAEVKVTQARLAAAQSRLKRFQAAGDSGALSQEQLAEAQLQVEQEKQAIQSVNASLEFALAALNPSPAEVTMAQQRIKQAQKSGQANIARLNQEKQALGQQRISIQQQLEQDREELSQVNIELDNTKITATAEGIISDLALRNPGQTVQPGQEIAQIIPSNADIEIKIPVSTQDISKLEIGQKVQMRISACSYTDYGILEGKVKKIPKDTRKPERNNDFARGSSAPTFYDVSITPDTTSFGNGEKTCSLQLGMEGTADIITQEETVMRFLLRKARLISNI